MDCYEQLNFPDNHYGGKSDGDSEITHIATDQGIIAFTGVQYNSDWSQTVNFFGYYDTINPNTVVRTIDAALEYTTFKYIIGLAVRNNRLLIATYEVGTILIDLSSISIIHAMSFAIGTNIPPYEMKVALDGGGNSYLTFQKI